MKMGSIGITLIIDNKKYYMTTRTHGKYIEIDYKLVTKNISKFKGNYFETNGINFDNYKK